MTGVTRRIGGVPLWVIMVVLVASAMLPGSMGQMVTPGAARVKVSFGKPKHSPKHHPRRARQAAVKPRTADRLQLASQTGTTIGCFIGSCTSNLMVEGGTNGVVRLNGQQIGLYIDDSTPNQCKWVNDDRVGGYSGLIIASRWDSDSCPNSLVAQEWYPYNWGMWGLETVHNVPCGQYQAFIIQWKFMNPTEFQRDRMLNAVLDCRPAPQYVILY